MGSEIRFGKVSSIDYDSGMVRVTYRDKDDTVTMPFAMLNYNDEYRMPKVGEQVAVAHLSNGSSRGVILGTEWNKKNRPHEAGENIYRKDLSRKKNAAYIRYDDKTGEYLVKVANLHLNGVNKTVLDGPELEIAANISILIQTDEMTMDFPELVVTSGDAEALHGKINTDIVIEQEGNQTEAVILKAALEFVEDLDITAGTDVGVTAEGDVKVSAGGELHLKDKKYDVTLSEIMERLETLGG